MRHIRKQGNGGFHLQQAHQQPPQTEREATSRWRSFGHKQSVSEQLLAEQYGLCAYSEIRPETENYGTHIEHVQPKSHYPGLTFAYSNLVLSALSSDDLSQLAQAEVFAGHAKRDEYDASLFVSCLQADCARYFAYLSDGRVEPALALTPTEISQAEYTIQLLNLNSPYLVNRRKNWLNEIDSLIDDHLDQDWSLTHLAAIDLLPTNHKLSPFFSATRQRFANIAEQLLQNQAPELV